MSAELLRVHPAGGTLGRKNGVLVAGLILTILGPVAIVVPHAAGSAGDGAIGAVLALSGVIQLHQAFAMRFAPRAFRRGLSGLLWFTAGVVFLLSTLASAAALSMLVAALIGADGLLRFSEGARLRGRETGWGWLILAGALCLALAGSIAGAQPLTSYWAMGILLGATLVIDGAALILTRRLLR
jgi:uncharacterized membrane protein HdeD (DUF308 family)